MRLLHGYAFRTYVYPLFVARLSVLGVSHRGTSRSVVFSQLSFLPSFFSFPHAFDDLVRKKKDL